MSATITERSTVVIIGSGVAGLTTANLLRTAGIDSIILERRDRDYIERRQRAGLLDARSVRIFEKWGLGDQIVAGPPYSGAAEMRTNGVHRLLIETHDAGETGRMVPQQVLIIKLIDNLLREGGDIRFSAADVSIELDHATPRVSYTDSDGNRHEINAQFVAGADGDLGVSRSVVPADAMTRYTHDYGYAWLSVLANVPTGTHPQMGLHERGFAAQFARGRDASRFYLQVDADDTATRWSHDRIWEELALRLEAPNLPRGEILEHNVFPLRSVVTEPMQYGSLYLLGDAAHIVPPASAKGANLAIFDADTFAAAVRDAIQNGSSTALEEYSDICVANAWNYQEYAVWVSEMLHDAGNPEQRGKFRQKVARARLDRLFHSKTANRLYSEMLAGTN